MIKKNLLIAIKFNLNYGCYIINKENIIIKNLFSLINMSIY